MRQTILLVLILGLLPLACNEVSTLAPTQTAVPSQVIPSLTNVPTEFAHRPIAEVKLETQTDTAYSLEWSPDGRTLAVASGYEITLLSDDLKETQAVFTRDVGAIDVTWSPDATQLAAVNGFRNPTITLWDLDSPNAQLTLTEEIQAGVDQYGTAWSPDGTKLATLADDYQSIMKIWDTETWQEIQQFDLPYMNPRRALDWGAGSTTIYDAGELDGDVIVFAMNVTDGSVQELVKFSPQEIYVFTVSPNEKNLAIADEKGYVRVVDVSSGELLKEFQAASQPVDLEWNPNQPILAVLSYKTVLQLWEIPQ